MQIQCPSCKKQYSIDGSKVTEQGVKIICPACKHQFIMRRKAEDKPKPKPEPQKPKTPPCAVCGAPSTHVFRGPPPRPLCEIHYKIESEKESRFFDDVDPGKTSMAPAPPPAAARPADPGRTSVGAPPPPPQHDGNRTRVAAPAAPAPAKPSAPPPGMSQPSFDSFDDFDFSDLDSAGASRPGVSRPGSSMPGLSSPGFSDPNFSAPNFSDPGMTSAPPPKPAAPKKVEAPAEEAFTASPFEFMEDSAAANAAPPEPPPPEPDDSDDPFRPESNSASQPGFPSPEKSIPDFMPDPDDDPGMDFSSPPKQTMNLDGSAVAKPASPEPEDDFDFGWEDKPKTTSKLDEEMQSPAAKAGPTPPVVRPATRADYEAARLAKPRSSATSIAAALLLFLAVIGSVLFSLSGRANQTPVPEAAFDPPAGVWQGRLQDSGLSSSPDQPTLPTLEIEGGSQEQIAQSADEQAQRAMQQALRDTPAGYAAALTAIEAALAAEPDNGRYQALRVDILAFREALAAGGRPDKAGASAQALAEATGQHPLLTRAKAHVYLNDNKTAAATALLNNYLAENPQDGVAVFLLGMAIKNQPAPDKAEATRQLEKAISLEPALARAYLELARLYREQGQYKAAIDIYNRMLTSFPDHEGTADAMEETLREQKGVGPNGQPPANAPAAITIIPQAEAPPEGIAGTGNAIGRAIVDAINEVEPRLRRVQPNLEPVQPPRTTGPRSPQMPKPPEEAQ